MAIDPPRNHNARHAAMGRRRVVGRARWPLLLLMLTLTAVAVAADRM